MVLVNIFKVSDLKKIPQVNGKEDMIDFLQRYWPYFLRGSFCWIMMRGGGEHQKAVQSHT